MRNIVYFVGAGLSKSLQRPQKPIPLMNDFISVLADYLKDDVIRLFLAKLEQMQPCPYQWKSPEANALANKLLADWPTSSIHDLDTFKRSLKNRPFESIESLLEKVQSAGNKELVIRFGYAIDKFFDLIGWEVNWPPLETFISNQLLLDNASHTFVSFNYDLLLDRSIEKLSNGYWDISNGYGHSINYGVLDRFPPMVSRGGPLPSINAFQLNGSGSFNERIYILKPNGSLNWLVPLQTSTAVGGTGMQFKQGPVIVPVTIEHGLRYVGFTDAFNYVTLPDDGLSNDVSPCLLPPVRAKSTDLSFLKAVRHREHEAIRNADEIYILGWSVPKTDADQESLIRKALAGRSKPLLSITVVNRGEPPEYFERIANLFNVDTSRLTIFNSGFCDFAQSRSS